MNPAGITYDQPLPAVHLLRLHCLEARLIGRRCLEAAATLQPDVVLGLVRSFADPLQVLCALFNMALVFCTFLSGAVAMIDLLAIHGKRPRPAVLRPSKEVFLTEGQAPKHQRVVLFQVSAAPEST